MRLVSSALDKYLKATSQGPIRLTDKGLALAEIAGTLSSHNCTALNRGEMRRTQGDGSTTVDTIQACFNKAGTYAWQSISGPTLTLGPWYFPDVPGTATTEMLLGYFNTTSAVSTNSAGPSGRLRMPSAGKVIAAFLVSDAARTAGTCTLQVGISGVGSAFASGACVLDGSFARSNSAMDQAGFSFAANDSLSPIIVTSGWTPTTANVTAWLVVRLGT